MSGTKKDWTKHWWFGISCGHGACIVYAEHKDHAISAMERWYGSSNAPYLVTWSRAPGEGPPRHAFSSTGGAFINCTRRGFLCLESYPSGRPVLPRWLQMMVCPEDGGILVDGRRLEEVLQSEVDRCEVCGCYYFSARLRHACSHKQGF